MNIKDSKIVVTGGAGFIGSHIVDALLAKGAKVVVIDDLSTGRKQNIAHVLDRIEFIEASILDQSALDAAFAGAQAVVHEAALPSVPKSIELPMETHMANSTGTLAVFIAARKAGVGRVVYATSSSVYGDTPVLPKAEDMATDPLSPYAIHKLTAELYAKVFHSLHGLETIGLRYFNVFGPRQNPDSAYAAVIPKFIMLIKAGKRPTIFGDGGHTRDFTFVANVVDANVKALEAGAGFGAAYNIASGGQISLNDLVSGVNKILGASVEPIYEKARAGDIRDSFADISLARKTLGFAPKVSFDEGLKLTVDSL